MTDATSPSRPPHKRVLIVEDDEGLRDAMARSMTKAGFEVVSAASGVGALEAARAARPDAAVIDVFLPDAGGLGVARELRERIPSVPVLFITALALPVVRKTLAPTPVLFKPFTRRQLLASLRRIAPSG